MRIGHGYDVHAFSPERKLILGGVEIPSELGLLGHSDADVLTHALMDALCGAARLGDIGSLFPDTDQQYKDISSLYLLSCVTRKLSEAGFCIVDCDCTILAQQPKLAPYRDDMRKKLAQTMDIPVEHIGIKATTTEKLGFIGRCEGIAAEACVLLEKQ